MKTVKDKIKSLKKTSIRLQVYFPSSDDALYLDVVRIAEITGRSVSEVAMQSIMVGIINIGDVLLKNQSNLNRAVANAMKNQNKRRGKNASAN